MSSVTVLFGLTMNYIIPMPWKKIGEGFERDTSCVESLFTQEIFNTVASRRSEFEGRKFSPTIQSTVSTLKASKKKGDQREIIYCGETRLKDT